MKFVWTIWANSSKGLIHGPFTKSGHLYVRATDKAVCHVRAVEVKTQGIAEELLAEFPKASVKMGGGMETNKNRFIEDWGTARENLEHNFRWTRRNLALVGLFGVAIPIFIYKGIVREFHMQDEDAGRPYRKFL